MPGFKIENTGSELELGRDGDAAEGASSDANPPADESEKPAKVKTTKNKIYSDDVPVDQVEAGPPKECKNCKCTEFERAAGRKISTIM